VSLFQLLENWCLKKVSVQISEMCLSSESGLFSKHDCFFWRIFFFFFCLSVFSSPMVILNANDSYFGRLFG